MLGFRSRRASDTYPMPEIQPTPSGAIRTELILTGAEKRTAKSESEGSFVGYKGADAL